MEPKNIDRLFQEKLKDFELTPNPAVWNKIETSLVQTKKKRRAVVWFRFAGVAAVALLGVFIYNNNSTFTSNETEIIEKIITDTEPTFTKPVLIEEGLTDELLNEKLPVNTTPESIANAPKISKKAFQKTITNESTKEEIAATKNKKNISIANKSPIVENAKTIFEEINERTEYNSKTEDVAIINKKKILIEEQEKQNIVNAIEEETNNPIIKDSRTVFEEINDSIVESSRTENNAFFNKPKKLKEKKKLDLAKVVEENDEEQLKTHSWIIAPTVSQLFSSTMSSNSSIDERLNDATKKGNNSTSFGFKVAYRTSKKWQFQTGIHKLELAQTTQDIRLASTVNASAISNSTFSTKVSEALSSGDQSFSPGNSVDLVSKEEGDINQTYGYIEVPFEAKYALMQSKKLEFHLVGGLSTLFLTKNNLQVESSTFSYSAGEANNLNKVNFTVNFGSNVEYHFHQKWYFDISPMIKFQTNTFDTKSNRPYFFGIYTGFNYKF
jgi:hypothetical protein